MTASGTKPSGTLGYLAFVECENHGFVGGYLIVNELARPVEFHCTAPIRPSRTQEILFGTTLRSAMFCDQIGPALLAQTKLKPDLLVVDEHEALALRKQVEMPMAMILDAHVEDADAQDENGAETGEDASVPQTSDASDSAADATAKTDSDASTAADATAKLALDDVAADAGDTKGADKAKADSDAAADEKATIDDNADSAKPSPDENDTPDGQAESSPEQQPAAQVEDQAETQDSDQQTAADNADDNADSETEEAKPKQPAQVTSVTGLVAQWTFELSGHSLTTADGFQDDQEAVRNAFKAIPDSWDLAEPLQRIRFAITEAQRAAA